VTSKSSLIEESMGPEHNRRVLSKALHPSSFHCCHLQDPFMYPCILPFRPVRSSVSSAMGFTLPAKFCREGAVDQGATRRVTPLNTLSLHYFHTNTCHVFLGRSCGDLIHDTCFLYTHLRVVLSHTPLRKNAALRNSCSRTLLAEDAVANKVRQCHTKFSLSGFPLRSLFLI
jgi:hypothetical protein